MSSDTNTFLTLKLDFKTSTTFSMFLLFLERLFLLILNLFISDYLDQILPCKKMKETLSTKLQTQNLYA